MVVIRDNRNATLPTWCKSRQTSLPTQTLNFGISHLGPICYYIYYHFFFLVAQQPYLALNRLIVDSSSHPEHNSPR